MTPHTGSAPLTNPAVRYYCPACLHGVLRSQAARQVCRDGVVGAAVWLLRCPTCGLTLDADVVPRSESTPSK